MKKEKGQLIMLSGPSGVGKSTVTASLAAAMSSPLAASHSADRFAKVSAMASRAAFFLAVPAVANV